MKNNARTTLREFLADLRRRGYTDEEIVNHLVKKGVERTKAQTLVSSYTTKPGFSDLLEDESLPSLSEGELTKIRESLRKDLYQGESGLRRIFQPSAGEKEKTQASTTRPGGPSPEQQPKPAMVENSGKEPGVEPLGRKALEEVKTLRRDLLSQLSERIGREKRVEELEERLKKLEEKHGDVASEVSRVRQEIKELYTLVNEIIGVVKEIRNALR
ncbi:MAG: hypothetical protein DRO11_04200 [Methanobacteriota archaeon]|nr:MAG: hypothetical protein DRO11_04200 [Euryarchaeota archaeon]